MTKKSFGRFLTIFVFFISILVLLGHIFDVLILKSLLPQWDAMSFSTAFSFLLSATTLHFISIIYSDENELAQMILPVINFTILIIMLSLLVSFLLGVRIGIEDLLINEKKGEAFSIMPALPCVGTMSCFFAISLLGLLISYFPLKVKKIIKIVGYKLIIVGVIALVGHFAKTPLMYYFIEGVSSAMAMHTAILFIILGEGLVLVEHST